MENFRRYDSLSFSSYNKKGLSYFLMRKKPDEILIPYLRQIQGETVLEVGIGYGYYKDAYFSRNQVTGYDVNPNLGEHLGIEIIAGKADEIGKIKKKYDRVLSFFMTEYLNPRELRCFIEDGTQLVSLGGTFATTVIVRAGMGGIYTKIATMKGIKKYSYSYAEIKAMVQGKDYKLIPLDTYWGIPMAVLLEIRT